MNFIFFIYNRKNCSKSIAGDIGFYNKLSIGDLVYRMGAKINVFLRSWKYYNKRSQTSKKYSFKWDKLIK